MRQHRVMANHLSTENRKMTKKNSTSNPTPLPDHSLLNELLKYDGETGTLFWKYRDIKFFDNSRGNARRTMKAWNSRFSGKEAFSTPNGNGYFIGRINKKKYFAHRIIFKMVYNQEPVQVDHINQCPSDNRIENLRSCSHAQNHKNMPIQQNNTSGFHGVAIHKKSGRWRAYIHVKGKMISLGYHDNRSDAISARKNANIKYGFHENHGNHASDNVSTK